MFPYRVKYTESEPDIKNYNLFYKNTSNAKILSKFGKFSKKIQNIPKNTKKELCNLYILQNKNLIFWIFRIFEHFTKNRKYFSMFGVFVKQIVIFNIGFGFCVFNSIWEHKLKIFSTKKSTIDAAPPPPAAGGGIPGPNGPPPPALHPTTPRPTPHP